MWGMQLIGTYYLPLVLPVLVGMALLIRRARRRIDRSLTTQQARANRTLLVSAIGLWVGTVGTAVVTVTMIADAFDGVVFRDDPFGLPLRLPMIDSFYPNHPSPLVLLTMLAVTALGLLIGGYGLRRGAALSVHAGRTYLVRVLIPVRAIMIGAVLFTVIWGLGTALD